MRWWRGPPCCRPTCSLEQQSSAGRHIAPFGHIILIPRQPIFALSHWWCMLSQKATNANLKVFGLNRSGLEPAIYRTRGEHVNHYAIDAAKHFYRSLVIYHNQVQVKWQMSERKIGFQKSDIGLLTNTSKIFYIHYKSHVTVSKVLLVYKQTTGYIRMLLSYFKHILAFVYTILCTSKYSVTCYYI